MKDPVPLRLVSPNYLRSRVARGVSSWETLELEDFCSINREGRPIYDVCDVDRPDAVGCPDVGLRVARNL